MKKKLFYFAIAGWTSGLMVHLLSLAKINVTETIPFIWVLHIGIFVVWIPVIFELNKNEEFKKYQQLRRQNSVKPFSLFKIIFKETPTWLVVIAIGGFFYAVLNFMLFTSSQPGVPDFINDQYVLQNHGKLIKVITEQEYHHYKANELRGFSGHWLAFYGMAAAILFPFNKSEQ
ncbi:hypothetical protein [Flavobacterium sediminis]|nr:hypothetical protein [Flavobacterium sediminis]